MTNVNCTDWNCRFNKNNACSKDEIQLARSMLNIRMLVNVNDLQRCMSREEYPKEPNIVRCPKPLFEPETPQPKPDKKNSEYFDYEHIIS